MSRIKTAGIAGEIIHDSTSLTNMVYLAILSFVMFGMATAASINGTALSNETGRSGRTYDGVSQGWSYQDESSTSSESEEDTPPRRDRPSSFDEFVPDRTEQSKYPSYYGSKGKIPPPVKNWKGDWAGGANTPSWMTPSPADMAMMINMMKEMNGMQSADAEPTGLLSKLISDPAAILLPLAILLGAVIPIIVPLFMNANSNANNPNTELVSSTATGGKGRKLGDNASFVKPILEAIENFSSRSISGHTCLQRSFCEATRSSNHTDFRPIQRSIYKTFTFVDDYWLETLGVKQLMEAMGTGNCDKIHCDALPVKESDFKKKQL